MTEQQQREACAELARRMGWTLVHHGYGVSPDEFTPPQPRAIPDYFTDPAASWEMVKWLAAQKGFEVERFNNLIADKVRDYGFPVTPLQVLTAPLPIIARAACKALGIEVEE